MPESNAYAPEPTPPTPFLLPVLLVEPDDLARRAVAALLTSHGHRLAGAVVSGGEALETLRRQHVGVIVTEISLPDMALGEFLCEARQIRADVLVVTITGEGDLDVLAETLRFGVNALLSKYSSPHLLMTRIGAVFADGLLLDEITAPPLLAWLRRETGSETFVLPRREREVLELVLQGHSVRSVAQALGLAESTVKSHAAKAAARLGMRSSRLAATEASRRGLIANDPETIVLAERPGSPRRGTIVSPDGK